MLGGDLKQVSLGQGQVPRDVVAQGLQRVAVAVAEGREGESILAGGCEHRAKY